jgi:hypothetical protein
VAWVEQSPREILQSRSASAPEAELQSRVMAAVRAAVMPALPYPESDDEGSLPKDGNTTDAWMVRPHATGDRSIEVIANPLNLANQQRATKAMAQIQASLELAQRRSEAQYERAVAEAKRTGRSQDVDGVTLSDEGLAGARIDAEAHVTIDVEFNQPAYSFAVTSSIAPSPSRTITVPGAVAVITVPSNVYRQKSASSTDDRFCPAETMLFFGAVHVPDVDERSNNAFTVTANAVPAAEHPTAVRAVVIRLRGNEALMAQIARGSDWGRVVELLK